MAPEMAQPVTRSKKTSSFTWYGDSNASILTPLSRWPDLESSNGSSADDFSDITDNDDRRPKLRRTPAVKTTYETDVGDSDNRRRFRGSSVKVSYDSDSSLTPRSRRTLRRALPGSTEPWPSVKTPSKPALDTIFSPTHEILHPLQSLRLERSLSNKTWSAGSNVELDRSTRVTRASVTYESFTLSRPQSNASEFDSYINPSSKPRLHSSEFDRYAKRSPKPRFTPVNFKSYTFPEPKQNSMDHDSYDSSKPQPNSVDFESVKLTVRIAPGARVRTVVVQELTALGATYAIFDRKVMRSRRYYGKHLSCHAVRMRKNGRSIKTITLVPHKTLISDISSVSSMSTDRASIESPSPTFWRRITNFRSSRRSRTTSPRSSPARLRSGAFSPSAVTPNDPDAFLPESQDLKDSDTLSTKLKLFHLPAPPKDPVPADSYSYIAMESHRKSLPAISVTIPPPICAV